MERAPKRMTGFLATLTPEQRRAALAYVGDDCSAFETPGRIDYDKLYDEVTARFPKIMARLAE